VGQAPRLPVRVVFVAGETPAPHTLADNAAVLLVTEARLVSLAFTVVKFTGVGLCWTI